MCSPLISPKVTNELFVNAIIQKALFVAGLKEGFFKRGEFQPTGTEHDHKLIT